MLATIPTARHQTTSTATLEAGSSACRLGRVSRRRSPPVVARHSKRQAWLEWDEADYASLIRRTRCTHLAVIAGLDPAIHAIPYRPMGRLSFHVTILASQTRGTLYIGVTNDLPRDLAEHRSSGSNTFAGRYCVFRLVHVEEFPTAVEAVRHEKALKKWPRQWKIDLIERENPTWSDLARWPLP